jgi:hypothetical protein
MLKRDVSATYEAIFELLQGRHVVRSGGGVKLSHKLTQ